MKASFAKKILKSFKWQAVNEVEKLPEKFVLIIAPHTSFWDFIIGWLLLQSLSLKPKILIKKEYFFFPLGRILRKLGAIAVNRQNANSFVNNIVKVVNESKEIVIAITPEGTRSANPNWKRGAITIANYAKIPIVVGVLDYKEKTGKIVDIYYPTGDNTKDMINIKSYYKTATAKFPENFKM